MGPIVSSEWAALVKQKRMTIEREGFCVDVQVNPAARRVYMATTIFDGGNFVPKSVRGCLQGHGFRALDPQVEVRLTIDEQQHRVLLLVQAVADEREQFGRVIQEFFELAHEWRAILDEYGQHDLIYIPANN